MAAQAKSATQEALQLPEILDNIFRHIFDDDFHQESECDSDEWMQMIPGYQRPEPEDDATSNLSDEAIARGQEDASEEEPLYTLSESFGNYGVLVRCALVSRLWAEIALPVLWEDYQSWMASECNIPSRFEKIEPSRRQYYANLVRELAMYTISEETQDKVSIYTDGISFPNVAQVKLFVNGSSWTSEVPDIKAPNLSTLHIDPHYEQPPCEVYVFLDEWKKVLSAIPKQFPSIKCVTFEDVSYISAALLETFKNALPNLQNCDSKLVRPPQDE